MMKTILISILLLLVAFAAQADDNVFRAQFTTHVTKKEPVDNLRKLENTFTSVYFFTDIRECVSCDVEHVWYHNGKKVFTKSAVAKYPRYRWWTKKTLNDDMLGKWTVKVKINDDVRVKRKLTYFAPTHTQMQQAPIQKRLMLNEQGQCETDLEKWHKLTKEDPADHYYKYMFDKVGKRCYGE